MSDSLIGEEIDGYRIQDVLGRGGMGVVYKAEEIALSRPVALKCLNPQLADDNSFLSRFRTEARAIARVDSPHIVQIYTLSETEIGLVIVMEYVEGGTLRQQVTAEGTGWAESLPLIQQVLTALQHAHDADVIHRDVKPQNILLSDDILAHGGRVKMTDFGLAKVHRSGNPKRTVTQGVYGTLHYMSPEQVEGYGEIDHRSDVYSLGMTYYEMLAGRLPFEEESSEYTIMRTIVEGDLPELGTFAAGVPGELRDIVMKAVAKDPAERFQSAAEMRDALEELEESAEQGGLSQEQATILSDVGPPTPDALAQGAPTEDAGEESPLASSTQEPSSGSTIWRVAGTGVVLASMLVGVWYFAVGFGLPSVNPDRESSPPPDTRDPVPIDTLLSIVDPPVPSKRIEERPERKDPADSSENVQRRGTLVVETELPNAYVFLDGKRAGSGTVRKQVTPGKHTVRVEASEYQTVTRTMEIEDGQTREMVADLKPQVGQLEVAAQPEGARIYVSGQVVGTAPVTEEVQPGTSEVRAEAPGYWAKTSTAKVNSGEAVQVNLQLEKAQSRAEYRAGAKRIGVYEGNGPTTPISTRWKFEAGDWVSAPVVAESTAYVGAANQICALDAENGQKQWTFEPQGGAAPPAVTKGTVYVGSTDGRVYALDAQTGNRRWTFETKDEIHSAPTVTGGTVYIGSGDRRVYALDAQSGRRQWTFETGFPVLSPLAVSEGVVYVVNGIHRLYALDAQTGQEQWNFKMEAKARREGGSAPAVAQGTVYASSDRYFYALDAQTGDQRWKSETALYRTSPAVAGDLVFVGGMDGSVHALNARTGQKQWSVKLGKKVQSSPAVAEGTVYVGSRDGYVYALDAQTGQEQWSFRIGARIHSSPAVVGPSVFVGSADSRVYALE